MPGVSEGYNHLPSIVFINNGVSSDFFSQLKRVRIENVIISDFFIIK